MKKNLVERVSGGANINSTVDLRQSSRYIIGNLHIAIIIAPQHHDHGMILTPYIDQHFQDFLVSGLR